MARISIGKVQIKDGSDAGSKDRAREAESRKKSNTETLEEAWQRIKQSKAYTKGGLDKQRLDAVYEAMMTGTIGREPVEHGKKQKKFSAAEAMRLWKVVNDLKREETLRRMVEETPDNYELITDEMHLKSFIKATVLEPIIAIDTETTGVDPYTDVIVGISLTLPNADRHCYIPVGHTDESMGKRPQLSRDYALKQLKSILYNEKLGKVAHNAVFDIQMLRRHGYDLLGVVWDTMTAMHLLNENEPSFKLKDLAPRWLGVESDTFGELFGKQLFSEVPIRVALVYAAKDTHITWRLYEFQRKAFDKLPTILEYYKSVEVPILYVVASMEARGYRLDTEFAKKYGESLHRKAEELSVDLIAELTPYHEGDEVINLNSTHQMKPALSKAIGKELPNLDAKKTLKPLKGKHEIIAKLLEYKNVTKLAGTYIDALPLKQNPTTKRWHSRFNPMGTVTGRFSSGKDEEDKSGQGFNVQNQPQEARPMFVPDEGYVLVGADFKAQEIRCVAYLSEEPVLIDAFKYNRDPYAMMASVYYDRPWEELHKQPDGSDTPERKQFKVVWLATLYGMSDFALGEMLGISKDEAVKFKEDIFGTMPKLNAWLEGNKDFAKRNGYVWADLKARKRRLPDAKLRKKQIPWGKYRDAKYEADRIHNSKINRAMRQGTNARVQGSSSIQTKVTMIRAHEECECRDGWSLWATVHDELIFEIPEDFTREDIEVIRSIMLESYPWGETVPNGTDIEVMTRWGEGVSVDEWFEYKTK
jgi:DNA polymerase I